MAAEVEEKDRMAARGSLRRVEYAVRLDGSMPAKSFYSALSPRNRAKLEASFQRTANAGEIRQQRKFKKMEGILFAFKWDCDDGRMIRMPCFRLGTRWILTHGFFKPAQSAWPQSELNLAATIIEEHRFFERNLGST